MSKKIFAICLMTVMALSLLCACGSKSDTINTVDTTEETTVAEGTDAKESENGLSGTYYYTYEEEMEGYTSVVTNYVILNEDGTGKFKAQDTIDVTWTADGIDGYATTVEENGDLTIDGITYTKLSGKCVQPNKYELDPENLEDGTYPCAFEVESQDIAGTGMLKNVRIYTEDTYDIADVGTLETGDAITVRGDLYVIESISDENGFVTINGGIEAGGTELRAFDEDNCYRYAGMDGYSSYTYHFMKDFTISEDVVLTDNYDPTEVKTYGYDNLTDAFEHPSFFEVNTSIRLENGKIVEINRIYIP